MKETYVARVSVQRAAELLGLSVLSVQGALINKALPIGGTWKNEGGSCYTYHISTSTTGSLHWINERGSNEYCRLENVL